MQSQGEYQIFSIGSRDEAYEISRVAEGQFYTSGKSCRKAYVSNLPKLYEDVFVDKTFTIQNSENDQNVKGQPFKLRRIYELYDTQFNIFDPQSYKQTYLDLTNEESDLPTFMSEFNMIDKEYFKTRLFTKNINKNGYYQYFVLRNGEYHVEYIDDTIPVTGKKELPMWGLSVKEPWKIILMKAWIKEKRGIQGVIKAEPYEFIEAFGLPGYRALSIKKQINSLKVSKLPEEAKAEKQKRIRLNEPGFITVGKTRNIEKVKEMGLRKNRAGYKIVPIQSLNNDAHGSNIRGSEQAIFKIQSQLPVYWSGQLSVASQKIKNSYLPNIHKLNIEKEFLATYSEISNIFSKFYVVPEYLSKYESGSIIEDSIRVDIQQFDQKASKYPYQFFELVVQSKGFMNININLPKTSGVNVQKENQRIIRYPSIKYFLTVKSKDEVIGQQSLKENSYITSNYQYYDGEYVKGYHKSLNRFLEINPGKYYVYVKVENQKDNFVNSYAIGINTNAGISTFKQVQLSKPQQMNVLQSTFYQHGKQVGLRGYLHKESKDMIVFLANRFDEVGFGIVSLQVHPHAKDILAMKIHMKMLQASNISVCKQAHTSIYDYGDEDFTMMARPGLPQTLILQRSVRQRSKEQKFPPQGSIEFFEIY